tara:strand:+ start:495 stop:746 length:252 start_codon:yes stop_codon:yes gene_type:complete
MVGELTFPMIKKHLVGAKVVKDEHVLKAMLMCMQHLKLVVEPGGYVGLGAILDHSLEVENKTTLVVLSGGNAGPAILGLALLQ